MLRGTLTRDEWLDKWFRKSKSFNTLGMAKAALSWYDKYLLAQKLDENQILLELRTTKSLTAYIFMQNYVNFLDDSKKYPTTIDKYKMFIRSWLRSQGVTLDLEEMKEHVSIPKAPKLKKIPIKVEQIKKLIEVATPTRKAVYLIAISSLMRIGEVLSLKKESFDITQNPIKITIEAKYTKENEDRETYITQEAWNYAREYWERAKVGEFVFCKNFNRYAIVNEIQAFNRCRKLAGLTDKQANGRYQIHLHKFRKFGHTRVSRVHDDQYANALDGHTGYLETYYELEDAERAQMYSQVAPELTIFSDHKTKLENSNLKAQMEKYNEMDLKMKRLQAKIARLEKIGNN